MLDILILFKDLFLSWLWMFASPIKQLDVLWIIIPIWLSWIFTEFFQEKKGASFGNAISNGIVPLWAAIDWTRYIVNGLTSKTITLGLATFIKFFLCLLMFAFGILIIVQGIRAKNFIHFVGRIRVVTYVLLMFTPIIYNIVEMGWFVIFSIALFFPIFYFLVELLTRIIPNPRAFDEDENKSFSSSGLEKL